MNKITIEDIISRVKTESQILYLSEEFPENVNIDLSEISDSKLFFQNIRAKTLTIENGELELLQVSKQSSIDYLRIKNVKIGKVEISDCVIPNTFSFEDCTIDDFTAQRMNTMSHWLGFRNCPKIGAIDLQTLIISQGLHIDGCPDIGSIRLYNVECPYGGLSLARSTVNGRTMIVASSKIKEVTIYQSVFNDNFKIESTVIDKMISIIENTFNKSCSINLKKKDFNEKSIIQFTDSIYLDKTIFKDGFEVFGFDDAEYIINSIKITFNNQLEGNINFKNLTISDIYLTGIITKSEISLNNISTDKITIEDLDNYSNFRLSTIKGNGNSEFNIINSNFGSAIVNDINFGDFILKIIKSTYNKINYSNTIWPKDITVSNANYIIPSSEEHRRKQDSFRQFKQAAKQNENKIDELDFQRKEWNSIRKQGISKEQSFLYILNDWIVIQSNRTNNYGTVWIWPILLLLLSNLIFYIIQVVILSPDLTFRTVDSKFDSELLFTQLKDNIFMYWHFLNPTHNLKHIDPILSENKYSEILGNSKAMFWNYFMRIMTGYFIYQVIVGFRKFSRK